jgi:choline dehydrogenase-like flavoprotein
MAVSQGATVFKLDTSCKAHELDNLYVADTSFFLSIGTRDRALAVMAGARGPATVYGRAWPERTGREP